MMKNYDKTVKINHKPDRPYIPNHLFRILTLIKLGFLRVVSSEVQGQFDPRFIFQEERIQYQYNGIQLLRNLFKVC